MSILTLVSLLAVSGQAWAKSCGTATSTLVLSVPSSAPDGQQVVDGNFQSYSVEFNWMQDFAGNNSQPNTFSYKMLENLGAISGALPQIRAGGSTQNRATFVANQSEALIQKFGSDPDQPSSLTIGPTWIESFQQMPKGTKYIYGLNFYDGDAGLNQTVLEAANAWAGIEDDIYAFEIGNEVDGWPCGSRRPCNWTIDRYVQQWSEFATAVDEQVIGASAAAKVEPLFQGCAFEAPRHLGYNATPFWNVENALKYGMASSGHAKTVADHDYMGATCAGAPVPTLKDNLLNHYHMTSLMYYHEYLGNVSAAYGVPYVLGETNSISCQGLAGVSDVFGAAIWSVDYVLYVASLKISRLYFHMGTPYRYSPWQAAPYNGTAPHVKALYYGNLVTASALAGGNKQVSVLVNETSFTAYGVYEANKGVKSVVLVNLDMWNSTEAASPRPYTAVTLPSEFAGAQVRRLTGLGAEIAQNITFAGRYVDNNGNFVGDEIVGTVQGNTVAVRASEAVLVTIP